MPFIMQRLFRSIPQLMLAIFAASLFLVIACSGGDPPPSPTSTPEELDGLIVFAAASDLTPGENRVQFVVKTLNGGTLTDSADRLDVTYSISDGDPISATDVTWHAWPVRGGAYTAHLSFESEGLWQLRVRDRSNPDLIDGVAALIVNATSATPSIGSPPPSTPSKTGTTTAELALITSDLDPDPAFYAISFDEAVSSGKPTVVVFSTPAYCQSATCGPQLDAAADVRDQHPGLAHFIHVELFDNPAEMRADGDASLGIESPVVEPWGLPSEPWTFVIDREGLVSARFEAFTTADEIEAAVLIAAGS
ncbi:MAG: hypothetical protein HOL45_00640 [Chloroflexi bacterium]|nr:hypothetical protein [Chloroflexota bacterium]